MLSGELPDVTIFTECEYVDFRLLQYDLPILEGRYYAINGAAVVTDIASLVESSMAGSPDSQLAQYTVEATDQTGTVSQSFTVLYCNLDINLPFIDSWLTENFLTLTPFRRIPPDGYIYVAWYTTEKEGIMFRVYTTFLNDKGEIDTYQYVNSGNGQIAHVNDVLTQLILVENIVAKIKEAKKIDSLTLQSVTVRVGNRSLTFYVDQSLLGIRPFWYTNCFNVPEQLVLPRVTVEKVKTDRSLAVIGRTSQFYDVSTTKEYEVQSGPLTYDEHLQIEQMLSSANVRMPWGNEMPNNETDFNAMLEILITDYTSELSDSDEKPNSVKFTWRFAENRPKTLPPYSPDIFNDKFNPTFQ